MYALVKSPDGIELPADLVVIGVGILPTVDIAESAGLECDNGIIVDEFCRTGDARIFWPSVIARIILTNCLGRRLRLESVHNAQEQAKTAAATILLAHSKPVCHRFRGFGQTSTI